MTLEVILLAKQDSFSQQAVAIAENLFGSALRSFSGRVGDPLPEEVASAHPTHLVSFLSPWIVPASVLDDSATAINFHPASADYPGIGCYNFALYEDAKEFGAVCHHMLPKVDTGAIVEERRFPMFEQDSVETLKLRTMITMLSMFHDIMCLIAEGKPVPISERQWTRRPFTRREMNALRVIEPEMSPDEVRRRVRAMTYPGYPGPNVTVGGVTFHYPVPERPPLA